MDAYPLSFYAFLVMLIFLSSPIFGLKYKNIRNKNIHSTRIFAQLNLSEYIEKAKAMVGGIEIDRDAVLNLAFNIKEAENQKIIALKDMELITKEKVLRNYYEKKLSSVSLRNSLELFFLRVIDLYRSGDVGLLRAIERTQSSSFAKNTKLEFPKMSVVNSYLMKADVWKAVVSALHIPNDIDFPTFGADLVYGAVSDEIHNPQISNIIMSDKAADGHKLFFKWLSGELKKRYSEFDEEMSYMGDELEE